jgi:hypothetical protein
MGHKNNKCFDKNRLATLLNVRPVFLASVAISAPHETDKKCHRFLPQKVKA